MTDIEKKLVAILADTLGKTGYTFLASSISHQPKFGGVMLEAVQRAYDLGRSDGGQFGWQPDTTGPSPAPLHSLQPTT